MTLLAFSTLSSATASVAGFLITYAMHSTIAVAAALILLKGMRSSAPHIRVLLCRTAFLMPLITSLLSGIVPSAFLPAPILLPEVSLFHQHSDPLTDESDHSRLDDRIVLSHRTGSAAAAEGLNAAGAQSGPGVNEEWRGQHARATAINVSLWQVVTLIWLAVGLTGSLRIVHEITSLRRLRRESRHVSNGSVCETLHRLTTAAGVVSGASLHLSGRVHSPLTAGIAQPFIVVPAGFLKRISQPQIEAMLAHEVAHVARRDAAWNLTALLSCRIFWFQPLNVALQRQLRIESEFAADRMAFDMLNGGAHLAGCLAQLGDWLKRQAPPRALIPTGIVSGMGSCRSILGRRVESLLQQPEPISRSVALRQRVSLVALLMICLVCFTAVPRASAGRPIMPPSEDEARSMAHPISTLALISGLTFTALPETAVVAATEAIAAEETPVAVPAEMQKFNGMIIGQMVTRDVERGAFTVKVDYIARVWENNKAENPRAAVGKVLKVEGVTGKFLDNLLLIKPGETVEFEAQHRGGDSLTFPGEWLRKAEPFHAEHHPTPPDGFRGFAGIVSGTIASKANESGELILRVKSIEKTFDRSKAKNADSIIDKPVVVAGFWGKMRKPFDDVKEGEAIRVGLLHRVPQSDHFSQIEVFEKSGAGADASDRKNDKPKSSRDGDDSASFPAGLRGFRGAMTGVVISRDAEKGQLIFKADGVPRVGRQSKATDPESAIGRQITMEGFSGKFLDVLLLLKAGDRIETGAYHNRGDELDFPGELFRKIK